MANKTTWTDEQDDIVTEIVQEYLNQGKSAKAACEEIAPLLDKTMEAVRARWTAKLRFEVGTPKRAAIRHERPKQEGITEVIETGENPLAAISGLLGQIDKNDRQQRKRITELERELEKVQKKYSELFADHQAVMRVLNHARKFAVDEEAATEEISTRQFKIVNNAVEFVAN